MVVIGSIVLGGMVLFVFSFLICFGMILQLSEEDEE